jgi:FKBP-type peptidyl-prolyl cis-trans isomerase
MARRSGWLLAALAGFGLLAATGLRADDKDKDKDAGESKVKEINVEYADGKTAVLKYQDLKEGSGADARKGDEIDAHYTGWLTNGKKFQSSHDSGKPITFKLGVGKVIKGWDAGIPGMKEGGKRKLIIPPELAYGDRGFGDAIPPGATLVFEVELVKVR